MSGLTSKYIYPFVVFFLFLFCLQPKIGQAVEPGIEEEIHKKKTSLIDIKRQINQKKDILHDFENKEKNLLSTLQSMDQKLMFKEEQLESYGLALNNVQKEKAQLESEIEDLKERLERFKKYLAYKIVQLYKHGGYSYVKTLFSAGSYTDLLKRYRFLKVMAQKDSESIVSYQQIYSDLSEKQEDFAVREEKILALQSAFKEKNKEILAKREERTKLLNRIRKEKITQKELLEELEASSLSLQATIDDLIRERETVFGSFVQLKGQLSWPVEGPVMTLFGKQKHDQFNTYIFSKGIDIEADAGVAVSAVYNGTVLFADWFKGFGQMLIIDHGKGFYSLYAHLSEISVPVKSMIHKGQAIGKVGDTGSLKGPLLYFEIRNHGEPQDPLAWLASREAVGSQ